MFYVLFLVLRVLASTSSFAVAQNVRVKIAVFVLPFKSFFYVFHNVNFHFLLPDFHICPLANKSYYGKHFKMPVYPNFLYRYKPCFKRYIKKLGCTESFFKNRLSYHLALVTWQLK